MSCVLCGYENTEGQGSQYHRGDFYNCHFCGRFIIENDVLSENMDVKHLIAGYLHETNLRNTRNFIIDSDSIKKILINDKTPRTTIKKLEKVLLFYYKKNNYIGQKQRIIDDIKPCIIYLRNWLELIGALKLIKELKWAEINLQESKDNIPMGDITLTTLGLTYAEQLISTNINSEKVFVAMGFKEDLLDACENAIKPACKDCGFDAFLISDKVHNNGITDEIIVAIKTSKFVVVDFTYNNCGAYFEAGYAQGHGREVIRCCKNSWFNEKDDAGSRKNFLHFDVQHYNTIIWENHEDLYKKLKNNIRLNIPGAIMIDKDDG